MILVGPTLGRVNTGMAVSEAPDEAAARRLMDEDPAIASGMPEASCGRSRSRCCAAAMAGAAALDRAHTLVLSGCEEQVSSLGSGPRGPRGRRQVARSVIASRPLIFQISPVSVTT